MKKYEEYKDWKNSHSNEMADLGFSESSDIFIYTRFTVHNSDKIESEQIVFAEDEVEAVGYIRHIFLYDILNDAVDDLQGDFKHPFDSRQKDVVTIMNYWFKCGQIIKQDKTEKIFELCEEFNFEFNHRDNIEYEIHILKGANELRNFLVSKYEKNEFFNRNKFYNICSNENFSGKLLKEFLEKLFNS